MSEHDVTLGVKELQYQSRLTAEDYLLAAQDILNRHYHLGFAEGNPGLVAALVIAMSNDFNTAILKIGLQEVRDAVSNTIEPL